jgi:hypothetical protein
MTAGRRSNLAASHRAKLLAIAQDRKEDFQFILNRWAVERFLLRLSRSELKDKFVLKGAMLFIAWEGKLHRPTKDLDLLGRGPHDVDQVVNAIREICAVECDDGLKFDLAGIEGWRIAEDAEYEGVRVRVPASLDGARIPMQIDIGFGDAVEPVPRPLTFPVLLPLDAPVVSAYPPEAVIAEKFHAMVLLGIANSRMKDFFDIWTLASTYTFEMAALSRAVRGTFHRRKTDVPRSVPLALTSEFLDDAEKKVQWAAFLKRMGLTGERPSLADIGRFLADFLMPIAEAVMEEDSPYREWAPPGRWR